VVSDDVKLVTPDLLGWPNIGVAYSIGFSQTMIEP